MTSGEEKEDECQSHPYQCKRRRRVSKLFPLYSSQTQLPGKRNFQAQGSSCSNSYLVSKGFHIFFTLKIQYPGCLWKGYTSISFLCTSCYFIPEPKDKERNISKIIEIESRLVTNKNAKEYLHCTAPQLCSPLPTV